VVLVGLKACLRTPEEAQAAADADTEDEPLEPELQKQLLKAAINASWIGAFLLSIIYIGFSFVAALHSKHLNDVLPQDLINQIAYFVLGSDQGFIVAIAVSLACITTAMALCVVFADYLREDIFNHHIGYGPCLVATLAISGYISTLNFNAIIGMLAPVLELFYPALIMLCVVNILYKLYQFKPVKIPVFAVFALSLVNALF
jgi:LIVCS family branched-chain amino acid:cation transporter